MLRNTHNNKTCINLLSNRIQTTNNKTYLINGIILSIYIDRERK